jgi:dihydroneopterin triphosphate diphosphatase
MTDIRCTLIEVCIYTIVDGKPEYLLLRRAPDNAVYPGIWQFVSGGIRGDERAHEAAYREMCEETRCTAEKFYTVPHVNMFYYAPEGSVNIAPMFAARLKERTLPVLSHEHDDYRWCTYDEAYALLVWPGQREGLRIVRDYITGSAAAAPLLEITDLVL